MIEKNKEPLARDNGLKRLGGGIGRRKGLKIPRWSPTVPVQIRP
jgi:hypothetical protein